MWLFLDILKINYRVQILEYDDSVEIAILGL